MNMVRSSIILTHISIYIYCSNVYFLDHSVAKLFVEMDTDGNDLVDALEIMSTLAIISGMDTIEKLHFWRLEQKDN